MKASELIEKLQENIRVFGGHDIVYKTSDTIRWTYYDEENDEEVTTDNDTDEFNVVVDTIGVENCDGRVFSVS